VKKGFNILKSKKAFALVCFVLFLGLFVLRSDWADTRIGKEIFNLGHLCGFFIVWIFVLNIYSMFSPLTFTRFALVILITLLASVLIEITQHYIGRSASIKDVGLNIAGTLAALAFMVAKNKSFQVYSYPVAAIGLFSAGLLMFPSTKIFVDEYHIVRQFPVLSDFSTPYELNRWSSNKAIIHLAKRGNANVLKVKFRKDARYSVVALNSFGDEWEKYKELVYSVNNLTADSLSINVRVHDHDHRYSGFAYKDRFFQEFLLDPGTSEISIELLDIYEAPEERNMNLAAIESIMLFTVNAENDVELEINKVFLR